MSALVIYRKAIRVYITPIRFWEDATIVAGTLINPLTENDNCAYVIMPDGSNQYITKDRVWSTHLNAYASLACLRQLRELRHADEAAELADRLASEL